MANGVANKAKRDIAADAAEAPQHDAMADERRRGCRVGGIALLRHQREDGWQPNIRGPDRQQRAEAEQHPDQCVVAERLRK